MTEYTGGMLALVPDNATRLAVDGGDDPGDLHLTLLYLGDNVADWPEGQADRLREIMAASAPSLTAVSARVMGHAVLNPDGYNDREPCAVYLIGDTPDLDPLRRWAQWVLTTHDEYRTPPEQHTPVLYHVTAGYGLGADDLSYVGPVRFSTLRLALAGSVLDVPLGEQEAEVPGPQIKSITFTPSREVRDAAAALELDGEIAAAVIEGKALDAEGLVWVAAHCGPIGQQWAGDMLDRVEVKTAGMKMGGVEGGDRPKLDETDALPEDGGTPEEGTPEQVRRRRRAVVGSAPDAAPPEIKVMSPSPGAAKLREYWAHGAGRAKWNPGTPGDFKRLRNKLRKYITNPRILDGLTANIHKLATGEWPGKNAHKGKKDDADGIEVKAVDADEAALHDGIGDWGAEFADDAAASYLADLEPPAPTETDPAAATARFAAMSLVADDDAAPASPAEDPGFGQWASLFDPPPAGDASPAPAAADPVSL